MDRLTPAALARLAELEAKATPLPWKPKVRAADEHENQIAFVRGLNIVGPYSAVSCGIERELIIESRNALPALLAEVEQLRAVEIAALESQVAWSEANFLILQWQKGYCTEGEYHAAATKAHDAGRRLDDALTALGARP